MHYPERASSHDIQAKSTAYLDYWFTNNGWIFRKAPEPDYGIDAELEVVDRGQATGKLVKLQLKGAFRNSNRDVRVRCSTKHIRYWLNFHIPVVLILCYPKDKLAYWICIQEYVASKLDSDDPHWSSKQTKMIRFSEVNRLSSRSATELGNLPEKLSNLWVGGSRYGIIGRTGNGFRFLAYLRNHSDNAPHEVLKSLLRKLVPIEQGIMELRNTKLLRTSYASFVEHSLAESLGFDGISDISKGIELGEARKFFKSIRQPNGNITLSVQKGLSRISVSMKGARWRIIKPERLLDCSCRYTSRSQCKLHGAKAAKNFNEMWGDLVIIKHMGCSILYHGKPGYPSAWPPSLESLYFGEKLTESVSLNGARVIDIGCGTGYLGILLARFYSLCQVDFLDWVPSALIMSSINVERNRTRFQNRHMKSRFFCEDGIGKRIKEREIRYDLVVCNPPFLPDLGFPECRTQHTVFGTDLLESVLARGLEIAPRVIVAYSTMALPEVEKLIAHLGNKARHLDEKGLRMPMTLRYVIDNPKYLQRLLADKRLESCQNKTGKYYHTVKLIEVYK